MRKPSPSSANKAPPVVTIADALTLASAYWETKGPGSRMMPIRAKRCAEVLGLERELDSLGPVDGTLVLSHLAGSKQERGIRAARWGKSPDIDWGRPLLKLSKASQASYYAAFTRMLALAGVSTVAWPSAPTPPRTTRDPLTGEDLDRMHAEFIARGYPETADLLELLRGTGMRVEVEALSSTAWSFREGGTIRITGKGGHEREVPVGPSLQSFNASDRGIAMRRLSYSCHLKRWREVTDALGIISRLPTPHAVRHFYATEAWKRTKDLKAVQHLLGHADPATTAHYIGVDMESLRKAAGCDG